MFTVASGTASAVLANLTSQLADPETLVLLAIVAAIPLTFWVIRRVIGLFPKGR